MKSIKYSEELLLNLRNDRRSSEQRLVGGTALSFRWLG